MKKRQYTDPKVRRMSSGAIVYYCDTLDCNVCHREINDTQSYYFTCEEMCDYDICFSCMTCSEGRQLYKAFKPYDFQAGGAQATCQRCNQTK